MSEILNLVTNKVQQAKSALCKFITANDTGSTGGHQCGFHISKEAWAMFLDSEPTKGANIDIPIVDSNTMVLVQGTNIVSHVLDVDSPF